MYKADWRRELAKRLEIVRREIDLEKPIVADGARAAGVSVKNCLSIDTGKLDDAWIDLHVALRFYDVWHYAVSSEWMDKKRGEMREGKSLACANNNDNAVVGIGDAGGDEGV